MTEYDSETIDYDTDYDSDYNSNLETDYNSNMETDNNESSIFNDYNSSEQMQGGMATEMATSDLSNYINNLYNGYKNKAANIFTPLP